MRTFEIKVADGEDEEVYTVQEESSAGTYLITKNQKFITRLFKDADERWKTREVSDLAPAEVNSIGTEIENHLGG
jgi:hypothetical protein